MFLDTANLEEIKQAYQTSLFKGVTTNPTILLKEHKPRFAQLKQIKSFSDGLLFCQVLGNDAQERFADYLHIMEFAHQEEIPLIIKVPIDFAGLETIKLIKGYKQDQQLLATAVYSAEQGILAAIAGCDYIAPYVNRMENLGIDAMRQISQMRHFIDGRKGTTQIMAASFKRTEQVIQSLHAGAHTCTIPFDVFQTMTTSQIVSAAIAVFNDHGNALPKD